MAGLSMRYGVFGGTFDPPHLGHLILAQEALEQLHLDRVIWVLTPNPPHKQERDICPWELRLELVQAAIIGNPSFRLSRVDIDRPGAHYAVDTLRILAGEYLQDELIYLIGEDSLRDLSTWYHAHDLVELCEGLGVIQRPGVNVDQELLEQQIPGIGKRLQFIQTPLIEISSSDLRERIAQGRHYRYYLPQMVYEKIEKLGMYK
jgi:nicotinate-nucleotide adenylyltransferase